MTKVYTLDKVPEHERHHYAKCIECFEYFDCRDLSQVVEHMHDNQAVDSSWNSSKKVNEPVEYLKGSIQIDCN